MQLESPKSNPSLPNLTGDDAKRKIERQRLILGFITHVGSHHNDWPSNMEKCVDAINDGNWEMLEAFYPEIFRISYLPTCDTCQYYYKDSGIK